MRTALPPRLALLLAGVLVAAGCASVAACVHLLDGGPGWDVVAVVCAAPVVAGAAAGWVAGARRVATAAMVVAADFAGCAIAVDLGLMLMLLVLGHVPVGGQLPLVDAALAGLLVVAVLAGPLGRRTARATRAVLAGNRRSPDELLADFADRAAAGTPVAELLRQLAESMRREWRVATVRIWWAGDAEPADGLGERVVVPATAAVVTDRIESSDLDVLARAGVAGSGWLRAWLPRLLPTDEGASQLRLAPAVHGGRVLGLVMIERAVDATAFTTAEDRSLAEVARRLGIVLRNRALDQALATTLADLRTTNVALQASRKRLVTTADAERKRIERDLHDGAQQHLVAIAVGLRLLRDTPDGPPDVELIDELDTGIRDAISALRDLAHGIYPPLLRDAGLAEAVRAAAQRSPLDVAVTAGNLGPLAEPVQAAVYFCCLEALQNAAKHAAGARVTVLLERDPVSGELRFTVADDGPGFDPVASPQGAGLENMYDRLGAIGGTLAVTSAPGAGTTVTGLLPLGGV